VSETPESSEDLLRRGRARGLQLDDIVDAIQPGVESLLARLRALADELEPDDTPPPERRGPSRRP
jgi:hypothetical protein